ncbi:MAG: hypothetical protein ACTHXA_00515 [Gulosibacter sp.]|uniref:hypothetical protein n=1 Tax=Gulosibacter sp. TaxID=2817531 RepID=UPI003F8E350D
MRLLLNLQNQFDRLLDRARREDRGDVPGWVLVALMSAGIVILLWTVAGPLLTEVFQDAINRVTANF